MDYSAKQFTSLFLGVYCIKIQITFLDIRVNYAMMKRYGKKKWIIKNKILFYLLCSEKQK